MAGGTTKFEADVQQAVQKIKGVYFPVKTGLVARLRIKKAACKDLYPNPEDEFCMPEIGPNDGIISSYEQQFLANIRDGLDYFHGSEPIIVEQLHPDGYMIINGHHRWAAAMRCKIKKVLIKIINCVTESDVRKMLERSKHDKRVAIDLDEVIFRPSDYKYLEKKAFTFPMSLRFKQRIRLGIPALFYYLSKHGYDIWLYASDYYSIDDIRKFFRAYSARVDGIITGYGKRQNKTKSEIEMERLIFNKYSVTLHIDNDLVVVTHGKTKEFEEYKIDSNDEDWSKKTIAIVEEIEKHAAKK